MLSLISLTNKLLEDINKVYEFWFGTEIEQQVVIAKKSGLWWSKSIDSDLTVKKEFGDYYNLAINDELSEWLGCTRGQLVLVLLLDQFSRVINRDSAAAFAQDSKVLGIVIEGISKNIDKSLSPIERVFYYMPLEHSEDLDIQNQSVALFQELLFEVPEELKKEFQKFLEFAKKHQEIIERFNRFPHRNKLLNRFSSAEEIAFLAEPGSSF